MRPLGARRRQAGLTLIEMLAATSIAALLSTMATVSFVQIQKAQERLQSRLAMHNSLRFIYQNMDEDFTALEHDAAMWVETTADDGTGSGAVAITFLKGKLDEHDFATNSARSWYGEANAVYQTRCTDLTWCCWRWNQRNQTLSTGVCSPPRQFMVGPAWTGPNGDYGSRAHWFMNMPQPLRQAEPYRAAMPAGSSAAALGGNRLGSPDHQNDISDYQDLMQNIAPVLQNVTGFHLELLLADGEVVDADDSRNQTLGYDGCYVDAHCTLGVAQPNLKRPRLIRVLVDVKDPLTGAGQSFSLSFRAANILPANFGTGKSIP